MSVKQQRPGIGPSRSWNGTCCVHGSSLEVRAENCALSVRGLSTELTGGRSMGCGSSQHGASQQPVMAEKDVVEKQDAKGTREQMQGLSFMWRAPTTAAVDARRLRMQEAQKELQVINQFKSVLPGR